MHIQLSGAKGLGGTAKRKARRTNLKLEGNMSLLDGIAAGADSLLSGSDKQKQLVSAALSRISDPATGGLLGLSRLP